MSAPPIGSVMAMPSSSAKPKNSETAAGPVEAPETTAAPAAMVAIRIARFTSFWPEKRTDLVIKPWSLANAMRLPLKETEPMKPPIAAIVRCVRFCSVPP